MIRLSIYLNFRFVFRPICWWQGIGYQSGHKYRGVTAGTAFDTSYAYCVRCGKGYVKGNKQWTHVPIPSWLRNCWKQMADEPSRAERMWFINKMEREAAEHQAYVAQWRRERAR